MFNPALISLWFLLFFSPVPVHTPEGDPPAAAENSFAEAEVMFRALYDKAGMEGKLDYEIYLRAVRGMEAICAPKTDILTIIDYSKPSCDRRFFVIDLVKGKLLYQTLVAHGKNSGEISVTRFSNRHKSLQSSPGFFLTAETYNGRHGYSLRLDGMEPGINDEARARAIVIHGADYVCQRYVDDFGYIGRSFGCPALPLELNRRIIDLIKGGSCIYIHTNNTTYQSQTAIR